MRYTIFKQSKPKHFGFKPRYYDADKEEFNARIEAVKRDLENDTVAEVGAYGGETLRQKMRSNRSHYSQAAATKKQSNLRVLLIAGVLGLAIVYFLVG